MKKNLAVKNINKSNGFTLIELIIFIVISGIIASMFTATYLTVLKRSSVINQQLDAPQAAEKCMQWYLGQRFINGFSSSSLTCGATTPAFCTANMPTGYNIVSNISCTNLYGDSTNYKTITVTVTGSGKAVLSTIIANY